MGRWDFRVKVVAVVQAWLSDDPRCDLHKIYFLSRNERIYDLCDHQLMTISATQSASEYS